MAAAQYYEQVQEAYLAYYGRPADPAGQAYWAGQLDAANGNLSAIINAFGTSTESTALYGGSSVQAQVNAIYETLFGRAADLTGLNFYVNGIMNGTFSLASVALNVYNGATGTDATELTAKLAYADAFTSTVGQSVAAELAYSGTAAANNARAAVAGVTDSASEASAAASLSTTVANIGSGTVGATVALTTGVDNITLTGNNNVVNAILSDFTATPASNPSTLTALDSITGTGTGNTLNIVDSNGDAAMMLPTGISVSDIQTLNVTTINAVGTGLAAFDVSGFTGLQNLNVATSTGDDNIAAANTTSVSVIDTAGDVAVTGGNAVTVNTSGSVTISGAVGAISVTDNATGLGDTISIQGGTTVGVVATAASNNTVNIGVAGIANSAGNGLTNAASEVTGNVVVNESTTTKGVTAFGTGAATIYTDGATSVSVTGTDGDSITDVETTLSGGKAIGTSTLASVTLDGVTGATTITSNALTSLTIQDDDNVIAGGSAASVVIDNANAHALALTVGANLATAAASATTVPTTEYASVSDATATSVTVATTGSVAANVTLDVADATSLTFNNAAKVTLNAASTLTDVSTITAAGAGALNLGDLSGSGVKTINASASKGGVTATISTSQVFEGGAGTNVVTLDGGLLKTSTGSITFGSGNNSLLAGVGASIGTGVTINGGVGGVNTISASLVNAGNAADISNFEVLDVSNFGSLAGNGALDASLMAGSTISGVSISMAGTDGTATLQNLGSAVTVTDSADATSSSLVLTHSAGAGTLAVNFADAAAVSTTETIASLASTGDTSISISSLGTKGTANAITNLVETDNHLTMVSITGSNAFTLGGVHTNAGAATATANVASSLTTIDGSAATGALHITAGASDAIGGSGFFTTYTGLTIKGGIGGDTITNHATNGVIVEGATASTHVNTLLVDGTGASINDAASAGADALTLDGANSSATLGSGTGVHVTFGAVTGNSIADAVTFGSGSATVMDNLTYQAIASATSVNTNGNVLTLNGSLHGETLSFGNVVAGTGTLGAATSVAAAQTFDQAVFAAAGTGAGAVTWFQYGGNTYIETVAAAGTTTSADLVKIAGAVDLSHTAITAGVAGVGHLTFA